MGAFVGFQVRALLIGALRDGLAQNSLVLARHVIAQDTDPLLAHDLVALNTQLGESLRYTPDASYIVVLDSAGRLLAHAFDGALPVDLSLIHISEPTRPY